MMALRDTLQAQLGFHNHSRSETYLVPRINLGHLTAGCHADIPRAVLHFLISDGIYPTQGLDALQASSAASLEANVMKAKHPHGEPHSLVALRTAVD